MSPKTKCSQENNFKVSDDLIWINNDHSIIPGKSKRRSSILKIIEKAPSNDERTQTRRVSFANNLFLQEIKPDGTTQLISEPFENLNDDTPDNFELQLNASSDPPVIEEEKRRRTSKNFCYYLTSHYDMQDDNDYKTVINTSANRASTKRKYEEMHRKDMNTLICNDDMELTDMEINRDIEFNEISSINKASFTSLSSTHSPKVINLIKQLNLPQEPQVLTPKHKKLKCDSKFQYSQIQNSQSNTKAPKLIDQENILRKENDHQQNNSSKISDCNTNQLIGQFETTNSFSIYIDQENRTCDKRIDTKISGQIFDINSENAVDNDTQIFSSASMDLTELNDDETKTDLNIISKNEDNANDYNQTKNKIHNANSYSSSSDMELTDLKEVTETLNQMSSIMHHTELTFSESFRNQASNLIDTLSINSKQFDYKLVNQVTQSFNNSSVEHTQTMINETNSTDSLSCEKNALSERKIDNIQKSDDEIASEILSKIVSNFEIVNQNDSDTDKTKILSPTCAKFNLDKFSKSPIFSPRRSSSNVCAIQKNKLYSIDSIKNQIIQENSDYRLDENKSDEFQFVNHQDSMQKFVNNQDDKSEKFDHIAHPSKIADRDVDKSIVKRNEVEWEFDESQKEDSLKLFEDSKIFPEKRIAETGHKIRLFSSLDKSSNSNELDRLESYENPMLDSISTDLTSSNDDKTNSINLTLDTKDEEIQMKIHQNTQLPVSVFSKRCQKSNPTIDSSDFEFLENQEVSRLMNDFIDSLVKEETFSSIFVDDEFEIHVHEEISIAESTTVNRSANDQTKLKSNDRIKFSGRSSVKPDSLKVKNSLHKTFDQTCDESIEILLRSRNCSLFGVEMSKEELTIKESMNDKLKNTSKSMTSSNKPDCISKTSPSIYGEQLQSKSTIGVSIEDISDVKEMQSFEERLFMNRTEDQLFRVQNSNLLPKPPYQTHYAKDISAKKPKNSTFVLQPGNSTNENFISPSIDFEDDLSIPQPINHVNKRRRLEACSIDFNLQFSTANNCGFEQVSIINNLSNIERELKVNKMEDSIMAFHTQLEFNSDEEVAKTMKKVQQNRSSISQIINNRIEAESKLANHEKQKLKEQIEQAKTMMLEESFFTDFVNDVIVCEEDKMKNYFIKQNRNTIIFKPFNNHITLSLDLQDSSDDEYSTIKDMKLVFDFDKPILKFWPDKFYLFFTERVEHQNFIEIIKIILIKNFNQIKNDLLFNYSTTEFLMNIEQNVEIMLNKILNFIEDIKITTLTFINSEFKIKQDDTFDFFVHLFGINNRLSVILNINLDNLSIRPRFNCWLEDKKLYPFDDIKKSIIEELSKEKKFKINGAMICSNGLLRKLRRAYLDQTVRTALANWNVD